MLRELHPSAGDISWPKGWRIASMAQEEKPSDRSALDYVVDGDTRVREIEAQLAKAQSSEDNLRLAELFGHYEDADGYAAESRAGEILHGLGFTVADFSKPQRSFSGGWRVRLALAQALMTPADLLLLDEPTNHLDLDTTLWLESWLAKFEGTMLVIAHDREFLDNVVTHTWHMHNQVGDVYRGNYSSFERQRIAALEQQAATFQRQQVKAAHLQSFIDRFKAKASKAKQAQSRVKALEKMQMVAPMHADSPYQFEFTDPKSVSNPLVSMRGVDVGYGSTKILNKISLSLLPGDRVGILGVNGAGKSTLLKAICGDLEPMQGELTLGKNSKVGYFAQHQMEALDASNTALQTVQLAFDLSDQESRNYLGSWGFSGEMTERSVTTLSGGEKARLVLALIARTEPALLVLDEPTNHLDLDMREALAMALQSYAGALLLVSHDRSLLDRCADTFWLVHNGAVTIYRESLRDYAAQQRAGQFKPTTTQTNLEAGNGTDPDAPEGTAKERRQAAAAQRELAKPLRKELTKLDKEMQKLNRSIADVEQRLADPEIYQSLPAAELDELMQESGRLRKKLDDTEHLWLDVSEQLEQFG